MKDQTNTLSTNLPVSTNEALHVPTEFRKWADQMDFYRLVILVAMILVQGCVVAPAMLWSMDLSGNTNVLQMAIVTLSSFAILVSLLSVQPMRRTIPVYIIVTAVQLLAILVNIIAL